MSKIVIIGAGDMGSAFALPCLDKNYDLNIIGTHLENDFIDQLKKNNNFHPGLKVNIPQKVNIFKFEKFDEILNTNIDLIVLGISSKGIEWVADQLSKIFKDSKIPKIDASLKGIIEKPIGRSQLNRKKMAVVNKGKMAITKWEVLDIFTPFASLIECKLETGRTHQIRVHMSYLGHGIIVDDLYGKPIAQKNFKNSYLKEKNKLIN